MNLVFTGIRAFKYSIEWEIKETISTSFSSDFEPILENLSVIVSSLLISFCISKTILSVFAGRIFDTGKDAFEIMKVINNIVHNESKCRTLWASPRMSYDYINAIKSKTDIITMQPNQIAKLSLFKKDLNKYSVETVKQFFDDANSSGFKLWKN